jgi:hypothetical protein
MPLAVAAGIAVLAGLVALGTIALGGGDADSPAASGTAAGSPTPGPTAVATTADFGPAPTLGGNVIEINPAHASSVSQQSTRSPNPQQPHGVCARVTFDGLPEKLQWFRMGFDGKEVTQQLVWVLTGNDAPGGTVCYAPKDGLASGRHSATLQVSDPKSATKPPNQLINWSFDVTQ